MNSFLSLLRLEFRVFEDSSELFNTYIIFVHNETMQMYKFGILY